MKKIYLLLPILCSCTLYDSWQKYPDSDGRWNVGNTIGGEYKNAPSSFLTNTFDFSGTCNYILGIRISNNCSPDRIATKYNIKKITEINNQYIWWLFPIVTRRTTIVGDIQ